MNYSNISNTNWGWYLVYSIMDAGGLKDGKV